MPSYMTFPGAPFTPEYFYETIPEFNPVSCSWQEDAQEYLCFLLEKIHQELCKGNPKTKKKNKNTPKIQPNFTHYLSCLPTKK